MRANAWHRGARCFILALLAAVACRPTERALQPGEAVTRPQNATCIAPDRPVSDTGVALANAFPGLHFDRPVDVLLVPGDDARVFVVEKPGIVKVFPNDPAASATQDFVDISSRVASTPNEAGLLGMAFHPQFAKNRQVFLSYTAPAGAGIRSIVSRFRATPDGSAIDATSEEILIAQDKVNTRHNGGTIAFGPDGFLYVAFGDDGRPQDANNPAQDVNSLQGKLLRIDVDTPSGYAIPPSNPFARGGGRGEVYAWGLRNPWRFSFDRARGDLWAGDVGEDSWEEVDRIVAGGNYGWPVLEGNHCLGGGACSSAGFLPPIVEYPHSEGVSITGGVVYRGTAIPGLVGRYVFADFVSGKVWALEGDPSTGAPVAEQLATTSLNLVAFAEQSDGEVLVLDMGGTVQRLVAGATSTAAPSFPQTLGATGCFSGSPVRPVAALIPYEVNSPLWSDGAQKERFFAIPDGTRIHVGDDGDWDLPVGSVVAKTFLIGGMRVETRLLMRHPDGSWAGYSYAWDDGQVDATLLPGSLTKVMAGQTWYFPSRSECLQCHTSAAGRTLGLETAQLNRPGHAPDGRSGNQLAILGVMGMLDAPVGDAPETSLPRLPDPSGTDPVEARARAYLHANCSICHRPGGTGGGNADYRFTSSFRDMGVCDATPEQGNLGIAGAFLVAPGAPARSVVSVRIHALGAGRMPPVATRLVDTTGAGLVDAWIASLTGCP
jgi:uncharacterized repeat protein (TIGR03806 family)